MGTNLKYFNIRCARHDDCGALEIIEKSCFDPAIYSVYDKEAFEKTVDAQKEGSVFLVAEFNMKAVAGYIIADPCKPGEEVPIADKNFYMTGVALSSEYRQAGLGRVLVNKCEDELRDRNLGNIRLYAHIAEMNIASRTLFERSGWMQGKVIPGHYQDKINAVEMTKEL